VGNRAKQILMGWTEGQRAHARSIASMWSPAPPVSHLPSYWAQIEKHFVNGPCYRVGACIFAHLHCEFLFKHAHADQSESVLASRSLLTHRSTHPYPLLPTFTHHHPPHRIASLAVLTHMQSAVCVHWHAFEGFRSSCCCCCYCI